MLHFTWHSFCHIIWHFIGYLARPGGVVSSGRACHNWLQQGQGISCYNRPSPGKWKKRGLLALGLRSKFLSWLHGFVGSPPEKHILFHVIHLSQLSLWSVSWPRASFPGGHFVFWGRWDRHSLGWQIDPGTGFRGEKIRAMSWGN